MKRSFTRMRSSCAGFHVHRSETNRSDITLLFKTTHLCEYICNHRLLDFNISPNPTSHHSCVHGKASTSVVQNQSFNLKNNVTCMCFVSCSCKRKTEAAMKYVCVLTSHSTSSLRLVAGRWEDVGRVWR